nr:hypothetical protein [Tanacetum cinerariifolium]
MIIARKRVRPLPVQQLDIRLSVDHSSSDSSSRHSFSDHSFPDLLSTSAGPSRKRRRTPMTSVPILPPVSEALSHVRADLIPLPKRVRDIGYLADVEVGPRETRVERVTHPAMPEDILEPAQEGAVEVTYETLGGLVQRIVGVKSTVTALTERVAELKRDNRRLRDTASVKSQRVDRLQRGMKMPNTRSRASITHEEVKELVARRVAEEMEAREDARNLETLNENGDEQEGLTISPISDLTLKDYEFDYAGMRLQHRQFLTSLIHIESCKSPTKSLFDVGSSRISIFIVNTFVSLGCSGKFSRKVRRTLYYSLLDLCAFGFSTQRLKQIATCSISTFSE